MARLRTSSLSRLESFSGDYSSSSDSGFQTPPRPGYHGISNQGNNKGILEELIEVQDNKEGRRKSEG